LRFRYVKSDNQRFSVLSFRRTTQFHPKLHKPSAFRQDQESASSDFLFHDLLSSLKVSKTLYSGPQFFFTNDAAQALKALAGGDAAISIRPVVEKETVIDSLKQKKPASEREVFCALC
jgi:predicted solute-binding protein